VNKFPNSLRGEYLIRFLVSYVVLKQGKKYPLPLAREGVFSESGSVDVELTNSDSSNIEIENLHSDS
jgi:hypothetical protein